MKKLFLILMICVISVGLLIVAVGCTGETDGGASDGEQNKVELSNLKYGFIKVEDGSSEIPDYAKTTNYAYFDLDSTYLLVITFDITSRCNNDGTKLFTSKLTFSNITVLDGHFEDVKSSNATAITFNDANNKQVKEATVSFAIPDKKDSTYYKRIVVTLEPKSAATDNNLSCEFTCEDYKLTGEDADGFTKNLPINKVKLATPVITFDEMTGSVKWSKIDHAGGYKVVVDDKVLQDAYGADVLLSHDATSVDLASYGVSGGHHLVKLIAMPESNSYIASESEEKSIEY